jgi:hypothetical protein
MINFVLVIKILLKKSYTYIYAVNIVIQKFYEFIK